MLVVLRHQPAGQQEESVRIIIPAAFTTRHQDVLTRYLADDRLLSPAEWQSLYQGINILDTAQVQTDVEIEFYSHDIRDQVERRSVADLVVLNLTGDVKTSTYFLRLASSRGLPNDFYVTRLWTGSKHRLLVVFQKPAAWKKIDGDTVEGRLSDLLHLLPRPVKLQQDDAVLIVTDYATWKRRVLQVQRKEQDDE